MQHLGLSRFRFKVYRVFCFGPARFQNLRKNRSRELRIRVMARRGSELKGKELATERKNYKQKRKKLW